MTGEALAVEADHLIDCILNGDTPMADGQAGLRTVRILDAADSSARANNVEVESPPAVPQSSRAIPVDAAVSEAANPGLGIVLNARSGPRLTTPSRLFRRRW